MSAREFELEALSCDNHLLAVHKPAGLPSVPDESGDPSLLDEARAWVQARFEKPGRAYLGVVQRLDRPVSGVVLFARTSKAAARLTDAFRERRIEKRYLAVVEGRPRGGEEGRVEQWLLKIPRLRRVRAFAQERKGALLAQTTWRLLASVGSGPGERSLVELRPQSGRPHQLRVALSSLDAPILGDLKYGASSPLEDRSIALHAASLGLEHPVRRVPVEFTCSPPAREWWELAR